MISNEVKAKMFAMYLGQECVSYVGTTEFKRKLIAVGGIDDEPYIKLRLGTPEKGHVVAALLKADFWKLILRTIDQLTDEEKDDLANILGVLSVDNFIIAIKENVPYALNIHKTIDSYQYLLSIGIDLPSIHLGGKTLIEAGLAIRKEDK